MRPKLLYIVLALALLAGNMALSGHLPGHNVTGSEICSLCVHAAGGSNAIVENNTAHPAIPLAAIPDWFHVALPIPADRLHDHPSRAPPSSI